MTNPHTTHRMSLIRSEIIAMMKAFAGAKKALIGPSLALTYDDARRVADRKSIWMVGYLRARRSGDRLKGFYRRKYFEERTEG
jgi:hypothetical protein